MSNETPDWRLEIWHAGEKATEIHDDDFDAVVDAFVRFDAARREAEEAAAAAETPDTAEEDDEVESFAESPAAFWAHFAAAALQRKDITAVNAAEMADELLAEYDKRFPEAA